MGRPRRIKLALVVRLLDCFASLAMTGRGERETHPVIARSSGDEAIQLFVSRLLDCFASLAMTERDRWKPLPVIARSPCDEAIQSSSARCAGARSFYRHLAK